MYRWGTASALSDDDDARHRLIAAAIRCIVRAGSSRIRIDDVAVEAGVSRGTVYRYFRGRDELLLGVILSRLEHSLTWVEESLTDPDDAALSLQEFILLSLTLWSGDPVNEALLAPGSTLSASLGVSAEPVLDGARRRLGPMLERWQNAGQLQPDLDLDQVIRWLNAVSVMLLTPPWRSMSTAERQAFLQQFVLRALLVHAPTWSAVAHDGTSG